VIAAGEPPSTATLASNRSPASASEGFDKVSCVSVTSLDVFVVDAPGIIFASAIAPKRTTPKTTDETRTRGACFIKNKAND